MASNAAWQLRQTGTAGQAPTGNTTMHTGMGMNRVVLGPLPQGGVAADCRSEKEEMADVEAQEATRETRHVIMSENEIANCDPIRTCSSSADYQ